METWSAGRWRLIDFRQYQNQRKRGDPLIPAAIEPKPPQPPLPPQTTAEQDITTAGQRKVNLIWEYTQSFIAVLIVMANIAVWINASFRASVANVPAGLGDALFVIVGFYYGRTNHAAIGGVGAKPNQPYLGR